MRTKNKNIYRFLIFCYIASLGFQSLLELPFVGQKLQLPEIFFLILFTFFSFTFLKKREEITVRFTTLDKIIFCYPLVVLLTTVANGSLSGWVEFLGVSYLFVTYFLLKTILENWKKEVFYEFLYVAFLWGGMLIAVSCLVGWGMLYFFQKPNSVAFIYENYPYLGDVIRVKGFLPSSHMVASILNISVLFFLSKLFYRKPIRAIHFLFFIIILLAYVLTFAKIVILLILAAGLLFLQSNQNTISKFFQKAVYIFYPLLIVFYLFAIHFLVVKKQDVDSGKFKKERFHTNVPIVETQTYFIIPTSYSALKKSAFLMGVEHPFFGVGLGKHKTNLETLREDGTYPTHMLNYEPHSTYFGSFAELGILGAAVVLFIFTFIGRQLKRLSSGKSFPILTNILIAVFFIAVIEAISADIMNFRHYWVLLAVVSILLHQNKSTQKPPFPKANFP